MELEEYRLRYSELDDAAPGWDAIDARIDEIYGEQEPKHWGTIIKHMLGGPDPLDGISVYESNGGGRRYLHFETYSYSSSISKSARSTIKTWLLTAKRTRFRKLSAKARYR